MSGPGGLLLEAEADPPGRGAWRRSVPPKALCLALVGVALLAVALPPLVFMAGSHQVAGRPVLLIDTDVGLDDLFALALLFGAAPDAEVALITTVRGMSPAPQGARTVRQLLAAVGRADVPVVAGAVTPAGNGRTLEELPWGRQYAAEAPALLASVGLPLSDGPLAGEEEEEPTAPHTAVAALLSAARAHCGRCTLLCIGPLTNVAAALRTEPGTLQRCLASVVVMGGAVRVEGNVLPGASAEFNFWLDPEAARHVVQSGLPLTLLDLGVANPAAFPAEAQDQITALPATSRVAQLMQRLLRASPESGSYDPAAVAYVLQPALFHTEPVWIAVQADGTTVERSPRAADGPVTLITALQRPAYARLVRAAYTGLAA